MPLDFWALRFQVGLCKLSVRPKVDFENRWGSSGAMLFSRVKVPLDFGALRFQVGLCKFSGRPRVDCEVRWGAFKERFCFLG